MKSTIALITYPGCILYELTLALEFLSKKFDIITYSPDGSPHLSSLGFSIASLKYSDTLPENCAAILIPGGNFESIRENSSLDKLIQEGNKQGIVLAAICGGVFALAKAGALNNRKFVHPFDAEQMKFLFSYFSDAIPEDKDFLHDQNILTAKPFAHIDFAVELAFKLGAIPQQKIIFYKNYHRGFPSGRIRPLAIGIIQRENGQILVHEGVDIVKKSKFYRPLGGGIEFGESAKNTLIREIAEEIDQEIIVEKYIGCIENFFEFEGRTGHEFLQMYFAKFTNPSAYEIERYEINESGASSGYAVWKSITEAKQENIPFYPLEMEKMLQGQA
jgi:putative intracellular protease/amidase/8-oxo-dGTP pyrophosphatase MutT (NUDIX family)